MTDTIWAGIIGSAIALLGVFFSNRHQTKIFNEKEETESKAVLKAIISELQSLKYILEIEFQEKLCSEETIFEWIVPIGTDYFSIYHSNTSKIGKIKNDELRNKIIQTYILAKFFLDSISTNNAQIAERNELIKESKNLNAIEQKSSIITPAMKRVWFDVEISHVNSRLEYSKKINLRPNYQKINQLIDEVLKIYAA